MTGWAVAAGAVLGGVSSYMGAKEQNKAAKEAAKPKPYESHRTPYMNEYLSQYAPWLMAMQQKIFESRLKAYGLDPAQFSLGPMASGLAMISPTYSGVGVAGKAPIMRGGSYYEGVTNPFSQYVPTGQPGGPVDPELLRKMAAARALRSGGGAGVMQRDRIAGRSY